MERKRFRAIAHIEKTKGRAGEVVAVAADGLPLLVRKGLRVAPVPPSLRGPRFFTIASCFAEGRGARLGFEGVADLNAASKLVGKTLLAAEADLPDDLALRDRRAVLGMEVVDEVYGALGSVEEVLVGDYQDVWVVRGVYGEVLVPVVSEIVRIENGVAHTTLPKGLVEVGEAEK